MFFFFNSRVLHGAECYWDWVISGIQWYSWLTTIGRPQHLPYGVQNISILKYPQQFIVCSDFMEVGSFLIGKEQIWFPYRVQHRGVQVQRVIRVLRISQPGIVPLLTEEDVDTVVLRVQNNVNRTINPMIVTQLLHAWASASTSCSYFKVAKVAPWPVSSHTFFPRCPVLGNF